MIEVLAKYPTNGLNEDGYFARGVKALGGSLPSFEEAMQFSGLSFYIIIIIININHLTFN